jgi:hypothetical protein
VRLAFGLESQAPEEQHADALAHVRRILRVVPQDERLEAEELLTRRLCPFTYTGSKNVSWVSTVRPRSPFGRNESSESWLIAKAVPNPMLPSGDSVSRRNGAAVMRIANV